MSLCLVNIHGDIEGDYDIITDLPRNATNGDVIKALFPDAKTTEYGDCLVDFTYQTESQFFTLDWWNAPYERRRVNENRHRT